MKASGEQGESIDEMLEWMREQKRAVKKYREECHRQWELKSPRAHAAPVTSTMIESPKKAQSSPSVRMSPTLTAQRRMESDDGVHVANSSFLYASTPRVIASLSPRRPPADGDQGPTEHERVAALSQQRLSEDNELLMQSVNDLRRALASVSHDLRVEVQTSDQLRRRVRELEIELCKREAWHAQRAATLLDTIRKLSGKAADDKSLTKLHDDVFTESEHALFAAARLRVNTHRPSSQTEEPAKISPDEI